MSTSTSKYASNKLMLDMLDPEKVTSMPEQVKKDSYEQTFQQASQVKPAGWLEWSLIGWCAA